MKQLNIDALSAFLIIVCFCLVACTRPGVTGKGKVSLVIDIESPETRGGIPENPAVNDLNITLTGEEGLVEFHGFWNFAGQHSPPALEVTLGRSFSVYAFANAGFDTGPATEESVFHLRYPDNFDHGMPMACRIDGYVAEKNGDVLVLPMERLLSRVSIRLDRSCLDNDVNMALMNARIGNGPRVVRPFKASAANSTDELFPSAYYCEGPSDIELYTLENRQKQFDKGLCTYVEMELDYDSANSSSADGKGLIYRFYLRENDDYDVVRNCHYTITVRPKGNGLLTEDSWRVDKSSLSRHHSGQDTIP